MKKEKTFSMLYIDKLGHLHQINNLGMITGIPNSENYSIIFSNYIDINEKTVKSIYRNLNKSTINQIIKDYFL